MVVPPWLERLLATSFFEVCRIHSNASSRSECNLFCLDCNSSDALCGFCTSSNHKHHQVIQIRRSSYHDVVRVSEVQKVLDISGVQTYVINSARVVFLNERPQPKGGKSVSHVCQICGRSLLDTFRFCSLGCKLVVMKRKENSNGEEGSRRITRFSSSSSSSQSRDEKVFGDGTEKDHIYPITPNRRRRKGIPQRAPIRS